MDGYNQIILRPSSSLVVVATDTLHGIQTFHRRQVPKSHGSGMPTIVRQETGLEYRRKISHEIPNDRLALNGDGWSVGSIVVRCSIIVRYGQEATCICHNRNGPKLESQSQQIPNPKIPSQNSKPKNPDQNPHAKNTC